MRGRRGPLLLRGLLHIGDARDHVGAIGRVRSLAEIGAIALGRQLVLRELTLALRDVEEEDRVRLLLRKLLRGNIYLAKVTRVEPSLQAAFVDYGGNRHGFLAFNEIHPDYYQIPVADRQALLEEEAAAEAELEAAADRRAEALARRASSRGGQSHRRPREETGSEDFTDLPMSGAPVEVIPHRRCRGRRTYRRSRRR